MKNKLVLYQRPAELFSIRYSFMELYNLKNEEIIWSHPLSLQKKKLRSRGVKQLNFPMHVSSPEMGVEANILL